MKQIVEVLFIAGEGHSTLSRSSICRAICTRKKSTGWRRVRLQSEVQALSSCKESEHPHYLKDKRGTDAGGLNAPLDRAVLSLISKLRPPFSSSLQRVQRKIIRGDMFK